MFSAKVDTSESSYFQGLAAKSNLCVWKFWDTQIGFIWKNFWSSSFLEFSFANRAVRKMHKTFWAWLIHHGLWTCPFPPWNFHNIFNTQSFFMRQTLAIKSKNAIFLCQLNGTFFWLKSKFGADDPGRNLTFVLRRRRRKIDNVRERIPRDTCVNSHKRASQLFTDFCSGQGQGSTQNEPKVNQLRYSTYGPLLMPLIDKERDWSVYLHKFSYLFMHLYVDSKEQY